MSHTVVIYSTVYGSTERYARWISEELCCEAVALEKISPAMLQSHKKIIYGGGVYAGKIRGCTKFLKNRDILKEKQVAIFAVGMVEPSSRDEISKVKAQNLGQDNPAEFFYFRGGMNRDGLKVPHKIIIGGLISALRKKPEEAGALKFLLDDSNTRADFSSKAGIAPLIEYMR